MRKFDFFRMSSGLYSALRSSGAERLRYPKLYKKVKDYVLERYPQGVCSQIVKADKGWSCAIRVDKRSIILYITKDGEDYRFWEKEI